MNTYTTMKEKHQTEINNFPMFFAFNKNQFNEGMEKFNLKITDTDKIYSIGGGGYIKKEDSKKLDIMFKNHEEEMEKAMLNEVFVYDMFYYELGNHEYTYTCSITDTIDSLGLTMDKINNNPILLNGLNKACEAQKELYIKHG
jgi:hypothetical protein